MAKKTAFLGIDLGTTGMRALIADADGSVLSVQNAEVLDSTVESSNDLVSEQDPLYWKEALFDLLGRTFARAPDVKISALTVDSTSGTIIPIDREGRPLHNAMLHNDARAREEAEFIVETTGINVKPSFALSKILWIRNHMPGVFEKTWKFIHAADYIRGLITGDFGVSDFSNAVKTGYDLENYKWPGAIENKLQIPEEKLPRVVKTGEVVGEVSGEMAAQYGIDRKTAVVAGATDNTTSFYSSGAEKAGDWNTTLGTVIGIRGVADRFIPDPKGLLYAHRHPEGFWLPGAASNTGGEGVRIFFGQRLEEYDRLIDGTPPTGALVYPLARKSEKFPFLNMEAQGFINATIATPHELFKAFLEGNAFIERMIYEKIGSIGYDVGDRVFSMGGGANSGPWMQIRADVLNKSVCRAREVEAAFGAAIIAASGVHFSTITEAIDHMVNIDRTCDPDPETQKRYDDIYGMFREEMKRRGLV